MRTHDGYAHLRAMMVSHRGATTHGTVARWCTECELHLADDQGLCPLCRPTRDEAVPEQAADESAA